jgi:hypothetical protein
MTESIGNLYPTRVPSLSDTANIQEALRLYHYGEYNGQNENSLSNLEPNSIAAYFRDIDAKINALVLGAFQTSVYSSKGVLVSASLGTGGVPEITAVLAPPTAGQVLTTAPDQPTGLIWQFPEVTETKDQPLTNKTLVNGAIASGGLKFQGQPGNLFVTTLVLPNPTANKTISFPATSSMPSQTTVLIGRDTVDTLTNKEIGVSQLEGEVSIENGGTGANSRPNARLALEIFNSQTTGSGGTRQPYSGKIYVANPSIVGANGQFLSGAASGDLWFW